MPLPLPDGPMVHQSREEGGQGLIYLTSRTAIFRLQFIQRFLIGPVNLMQRDVSSDGQVTRGWKMHFQTDLKFLKLSWLPFFNQILKHGLF